MGTEYPCTVQTILQQLRVAYERTGWTMAELLDRSGLRLDRSTLRRKMVGEVPTTTEEAEALALALSTTLAVVPEAEAGR